MKPLLRALAAVAALLLCAPATAASSCEGKEPSVWSADTLQEARLCIGEQLLPAIPMKSCSRPLCQEIEAWRQKPREQMVQDASSVLARVRDSIGRVAAQYAEARPLQREVERWSRDMTLATPEDLRSRNEGPYRREGVRAWVFDSGSYKVLHDRANEIDIGEWLKAECSVAAARCGRALRGSGEVLLHAAMARTIAGALLEDLRQDAAAYIEMLDKRWEKYLDSSRFQYPWELVINDRRYKTLGRAGFVSPPEDQWIVMHPSAGMRYNTKGQQNIEPLLVLEVAGYQRWRWDGSEQKNLLGGSFVLAWTNQQGERKAGWGAMMHLPKNTSIGLVRHSIGSSNTTSVVLSADLAKLFEDKPALKKTLQGLLD